jgi:hypothetical protein
VLYSVVAAIRRSFGLALVAALAGNFALWSLWHHLHVDFGRCPQLWLIPVALILLAAEHLNRDRLTAQQSTTLRYGALGLLYLSSSADIFLTGFGQRIWPALVLMVLAIVGMLAGMLFRVRAYLFLGVGFLFLAIFSMIWNAAVDLRQTWVWWASGIGLGAMILTMFGIFEKRRQDVLHVLEQIKKWN